MKDLLLTNKIRGCEIQLEKLEIRLIQWENKSAVTKLIMAKRIKKLQQERKSYEKLYYSLKNQQAKKLNKKMHRVALAQDAFYELKIGIKSILNNLNVI